MLRPDELELKFATRISALRSECRKELRSRPSYLRHYSSRLRNVSLLHLLLREANTPFIIASLRGHYQ